MGTTALITMIVAWTAIISFLVYFMSKAMKTQNKHKEEGEQ